MQKPQLGRVLVVDDDATGPPHVRARARRARAGTSSSRPTAAPRSPSSRTRLPFDCVLSDVNMPELDGFELVDALRKRDDDIPVLLMTGDPSLDGAVTRDR